MAFSKRKMAAESEATQTPPTNPSRSIARGLILMLGINVVLPIVLYNVLVPHMDQVYALLLSGIPPMLETFYHIIMERRLDKVNSIAVVSIGLSIVVTLISLDARLAMVKDSFFTLLFGIAYWCSIFWGRENLIWYYYRRMSGPEAAPALDRLYSHPHVRRTTNFMCKVWGTAFVLEAVVRIVLIYVLSIDAMVYVSPILVWGTIVSLSLWNPWYVRYLKRKHGELQWPQETDELVEETASYSSMRDSSNA